MLNKVAIRLLILAVFVYLAGIATMDAFIYILCFVVLTVAILFGLLVILAGLAWKLLPLKLKKTYDITRHRFNAIVLCSVPLVLVAAKAINKNFLHDVSGLITFLGNVGVFVFAVFTIWSFISQKNGEQYLSAA